MEIQISLEQKIPGVPKKKIRRTLTKVLKDLACTHKELSILFTDNEHIALLNKQYRNKEGPTDVLAFPMSGGDSSDVQSGMLGDIVISVETAKSESMDIGESVERTIFRLLIHGVLHLMGFDHERSSEDEDVMRKEEERLLALIREDL
jgi:rRNA maturation RNase YbeY